MTRWAIAIPVLLALFACKPQDTDTDTDTDTGVTDPFDAFADADLTNPERVVDFANITSTPNMYTLSVLFGAALKNGNSVCPSRSETDGVVTYTGGCTDTDGDVWFGSATVTRTARGRHHRLPRHGQDLGGGRRQRRDAGRGRLVGVAGPGRDHAHGRGRNHRTST